VSHADAELAESGLGMSHTDVEMVKCAMKAGAVDAWAVHLLLIDLLLLNVMTMAAMFCLVLHHGCESRLWCADSLQEALQQPLIGYQLHQSQHGL